MTSDIQQGAAPTPAPQQLLTDHLDLWTTAVRHKSTAGRGSGNSKNRKIELTGIKKLRELILELAVRGKLVPQNPEDEPASELLKRIEAEKAHLVKDGKLKKQKPLSVVSDNEKPFELPQGWEWVRFGVLPFVYSIGLDKGKNNQSPDMKYPYFKMNNILNNGGFDITDITNVDATEDEVSKFHLSSGDFLFNTRNSKELVGKTCVFENKNNMEILYNNNILRAKFSNLTISYFLDIWMRSISGKHELEKIKSGTTNVWAIYQGKLENFPCPFPSEIEQINIVTKVNELFALCDQLEQQSEHQLDAHQQLTETLLSALLTPAAGALTDATSAQELSDNWQRLAQHFDLLFSGPMGAWAIDRLKDTILQLAVMGKLVPQNPDDEPAAELLKRIDAEKARLVKEGKIKKQKPLPPVSDDEKPFELPQGWEWVKLSHIASVGTGATPSRDNPEYYRPADYNWVTSGETSNPFITSTKEKVSRKAVSETNVSIYPAGTLIIAMYGQGKTRGQIAELLIDAGTNQACAAIQLYEEDDKHRSYIKKFFQKAYEDIRLLAEGGAQPNLNVGKVSITLIPLPPLAEQHRIVAKVDELFALCDQLKERLQQASDTQLHLTDALVEQALS